MEKKEDNLKASLLFSFGLIGQIGFSVAIPLLALAFLGRYLDNRFQSGHLLLLIGIGSATIIDFFLVKAITQKTITKMDNESPK